jgi:hypothetical protein
LIVDPNTELSSAIAFQGFQPIPRKIQVRQRGGGIQLVEGAVFEYCGYVQSRRNLHRTVSQARISAFNTALLAEQPPQHGWSANSETALGYSWYVP